MTLGKTVSPLDQLSPFLPCLQSLSEGKPRRYGDMTWYQCCGVQTIRKKRLVVREGKTNYTTT